MKSIHSLLFLIFIPGLLCLLRSRGQYIAPEEAQHTENLKEYSQTILEKINKYRKLHYFSKKIEWNDQLYTTADKEVKNIVKNNTFGDHDNFDNWEKSLKNDYCTQLQLKLTLSDNKLPTKDIFAQFVLSSLLQEYKYYVAQDYSTAGISMQLKILIAYEIKRLPQDQLSTQITYVVVIQLVQEAQKYSCKKALEEGKKLKKISLNDHGQIKILKCDQTTRGGGWTLIADVKEQTRGEALIIPIDDKGIDYTEILFEAKPDWYLNYNFGSTNNWDFDGYNFRFNCLRFGDSWYVDRSHDGYRVKYSIFDRAQDLDIITPATKCYFGGSQQLYNCAKKFIFKSVPKERLNAFSELQSAANTDLHNNIYQFNFRLYVR